MHLEEDVAIKKRKKLLLSIFLGEMLHGAPFKDAFDLMKVSAAQGVETSD